jgi:hypothetical protein
LFELPTGRRSNAALPLLTLGEKFSSDSRHIASPEIIIARLVLFIARNAIVL